MAVNGSMMAWRLASVTGTRLEPGGGVAASSFTTASSRTIFTSEASEFETTFEVKFVGVGWPALMRPSVVNSPSPSIGFHDAACTSARRYRVFAVADNDSRSDVTHGNACERDHISSVELAFSARVLAEKERHGSHDENAPSGCTHTRHDR